ncbi:methyl-accepting chemotaxis protein [candidate division CSSED10-310 bacterium]|uniref:Methyl-accepting chemotaxis protein n=1 Tax=candidate division CSSED10-310 bacterium TaxID=2855610 RepID=A0ABV6YTJ4_UNCC1
MFQFTKSLSIRWKMIITLLVVVILLLGFNLFFFLPTQSKLIYDGLEKKWESIAGMLAFNVSPGIVFEKPEAVEEAFGAVKADRSLSYIAVLNADAEVFTVYNPRKKKIPALSEFAAKTNKFFQQSMLHVRAPVLSDQAIVGTLILGVSLDQLNEDIGTNKLKVIISSVVIFILGSILAVFMSGRITKPITQLMVASVEVARGNLNVSYELLSHDEVGQLTLTFNQMVKNLREVMSSAKAVAEGDLSRELEHEGDLADAFNTMVRNLREIADQAIAISKGDLSQKVVARGDFAKAFNFMIHGLRSITTGVKNASHELASSSSEILASTSELNATTSIQASAISETTATVNELKQTAVQSAERANAVIELARSAVVVSDKGITAIESSLKGMEVFQEQVIAITDKMNTLSVQIRRIGEIISTVNDIAEQSNLLALNASIEAARAGEHGRGFAVVADEVKNLAMQSKQATAEVSTILGSIQKASHSAVIATAELSEKAEQGIKLADEAGVNIKKMAEVIKESSHAAMQIAVSSREQTVGIDQIAEAMENINQSVQAVASAMDQVQKAAEDLSDISLNMKTLVDQYII